MPPTAPTPSPSPPLICLCAIYRNGATPGAPTLCVKVEAGLNVCSPQQYDGTCAGVTTSCLQPSTSSSTVGGGIFAAAIAANTANNASPPPPTTTLGSGTCVDKQSSTSCASKVQKGKCTKNKSRKKC